MGSSSLRLGLTLVMLLSATLHAEDATYDAVRGARPDGRSIQVTDLALERDAFRFSFQEGAFHLLAPAGGRTFGAVFIGEGSFTLVPATENERRHLAIILADDSAETLTDTFDSLVLLFADETAEELERHAAIQSGEPDSRALSLFRDHLDLQKTKLQVNLHLRVLQDLLNGPYRGKGVFLAAVKGKKLAPALIAFDPLGVGNLAAGFGLLGGEESMFLSLDDLNGGFWYLSSARDEAQSGRGKPLIRLADGLHYDIDVTIASNLQIDATTTIRARPLVDGIRVLPVHIMPKLRIGKASVTVGDEVMDAGIIQEDVELGRLARLFRDEVADANAALVVPEPLPTDRDIEITIAYSGRDVLRGLGPDSYSVRARESWYPNLGAFTDLATYSMTYRYPRRFSVVSTGSLVSRSEEEKQSVARWETRQPVRVVGFNYGRFDKITENDEPSGLELDVYINRQYRKMARDAMADAQNSARVATHFFGPAPYQNVAVSQQAEWFFGQSWPSLVYLPGIALISSTDRAMLFSEVAPFAMSDINEFAKSVGWHEMAHQWWGHRIGWESYRDQWISEGFAEFTSALVLQATEGDRKYQDLLDRKRRGLLERQTRGRIPTNESGPISNGFRVSTQASPGAVSPIVYDKGAWVVHMLRMMLRDASKPDPDAAFIAMMRDFVTSWDGRSPSTADFQTVVERHMAPHMNASGDGTMSYFFDQWVHGTDIPKISSDLRIESVDGKVYGLSGTIRQESVPDDFITVLPIYLEFDKGVMARIGHLRLVGNTSQPVNSELTLPRKPRRALVNAMSDVLTR